MANRYVLSGAPSSPTPTGADWNTAYQSLPATLVRGDTYYIGAGTYPGYRFNTANNGSLVITVKKATVADHGTDTGWSAGFAGQASWRTEVSSDGGSWVFTSDHWNIDGVYRDESNAPLSWRTRAGYGFDIDNITGFGTYSFSGNKFGDRQILIGRNGTTRTNISIGYVYCLGHFNNLPGSDARRYVVDTDIQNEALPGHTNLRFHHMGTFGSNNIWFIRQSVGTIIEYCTSDFVQSNGANHGEIVNCYYSVYDAILRYNYWTNCYTTGGGGGGTALVAVAVGRGDPVKPRIDFYGNLIDTYRTSDGVMGFLGNAANGGNGTNCRCLNNTFVDGDNIGNTGFHFPDGTGNFIQNNLWFNSGTPPDNDAPGSTVSHNAFGPGAGFGTNAQTGLTSAIFVNYALRNFRLNLATLAGAVQVAPFNTDILTLVRGADGVWDRGAFEFAVGGDLTPPAAPTGLVFA